MHRINPIVYNEIRWKPQHYAVGGVLLIVIWFLSLLHGSCIGVSLDTCYVFLLAFSWLISPDKFLYPAVDNVKDTSCVNTLKTHWNWNNIM